ncbi:hypothetical protein EC988_001645 [Linderina pennispora]|nr:hypothetical protein EC988_001645 [Linderina pennispora]
MTTHDMDPPSDIDVDLSSEGGSEAAAIDEVEASKILGGSRLHEFGSGYQGQRRMDFSPSPSPAGQVSQVGAVMSAAEHIPAVTGAGAATADTAGIATAAPYASSNAGGAMQAKAGEAAGAGSSGRAEKEPSVESAGSARQASSPAGARTGIWVHFTRDADYATNRRGRCVYCHNYYSCSSGSTGNMWRHIKRSHPEKIPNAAPLATHAAQEKPSDSRPRKRQATVAEPPAPTVAVPSALTGRPAETEPSETTQVAEPEPQGTEGLLLRLLVNLASRNSTATAERPQTSTASLLGVLDGLSALTGRNPAPEPPAQQPQPPASTAGPASPSPGTEALAAAIASAVQRGSSSGSAAERQQQVLRAYVAYMVRELVPADRMLAPGLQALVSGVAASGTCAPAANELTAELMRQYEQRSTALRRALDGAPGRIAVSIGTGSISSAAAYLAVYAHWVDAGFVRRSALLEWRSTEGAATSSDIIALFEAALARFDLFGRLGTVTTSYTREFVEFLNQAETICHARGAEFDLDRSQATCIVSTLLDAQSTLLSLLYSPAEEGELPPLERLYRAVQRIRRAQGSSARQLADLYRMHALDAATLEVDETRLWGSTLAFVGSALAVRSELTALIAADGMEAISQDDWLALAQIRVLLRVLDAGVAGVAHAGGEFPSAVAVAPLYDVLADDVAAFLDAPSLRNDVRRAAEALRDHLAQCHPFQASPIYRFAPLFDPRLKSQYYADRQYDASWTTRVVRDAQTLCAPFAQAAAPPTHSEPLLASELRAMPADVRAQTELFVRLGDTAQRLAVDGSARVFRRAWASGQTELDDYVAAPLAAPRAQPLAWWRANQDAYPAMARAVREYLAIPASSDCVSMLVRGESPVLPDYALLAALDRRLAPMYACLHQWSKQDEANGAAF